MAKIAISTTTFAEFDNTPIGLCKKSGYQPVLNSRRRKLKSDELIELAEGSVGLIAGTEPITKEVLLKLPGLKVISRCGSGADNIDLSAAGQAGVKVFTTPDAPVNAVAELTLGLILNLLRGINRADSDIKRGKWQKRMGALLTEKNIGMIGFGRIGRRVAELLKAFNCSISFADPNVESAPPGVNRLSLKELLGSADIVSLHASAEVLILGTEEIKLMKKGAWLINVSRGRAVNEQALYDALKEGRLSGAALDVFSDEPYQGRLSELNNVILTPHIGSYAKEARIKMEKEAVRNLLKGLESQGGIR